MPCRNNIAKALLVSLLAVQAFAAQQRVSSGLSLFNTQNAVQLFDVDEGIVLRSHPIDMKFFSSFSLPEDTKAHALGCRDARAEGNGLPGRAVTDGDGNFVLNGIAPGRYLVRVEAEGFPLFSDCIVVGNAGEPASCKTYFYFRVSKKLPFFAGDILDGGCRQWVPYPCASLFAEDGEPMISRKIKIAYLDGSAVANVSVSLFNYVRRDKRIREKNPQLNHKIGSVQSDDDGVADLTPLTIGQSSHLGLTINNLKGARTTAGLTRVSLGSSEGLTLFVLFQRGCHSRKIWDIEVLRP